LAQIYSKFSHSKYFFISFRNLQARGAFVGIDMVFTAKKVMTIVIIIAQEIAIKTAEARGETLSSGRTSQKTVT
jgi:hypothetical protein